MSERPILHDFWRSSACYRVRIALNLLEIPYLARQVDLSRSENRTPGYLEINPQGLVPALEVDGRRLTQSLAIIEFLHATTAGSGLLPGDPPGQHRVRQLSHAIAMEIHPICNLSVATHAAALADGSEATRLAWMRHFISRGLSSFEALLAQGGSGDFCHGDHPTMADCCLIPQLYNADRWGVDYSRHARILRIADAMRDLAAVAAAHPDRVRPAAG